MIQKGRNININLNIEAITDDGMGVAKKDGLVYFVIGAITGDEVVCEIILKKKNYAIAKVVDFVKISEKSVSPHDLYFGKSGGSPLSRMKYFEQLAEKQRIVRDNFDRIAKLPNVLIEDIISMETPFNYRNKSVYPCGYKDVDGDMKVDFGYFRQKSHEIVFEKESIIDNSENWKIKCAVSDWANEYNISIYNEKTGRGILRYLVIRTNYKNEFMIGLVTNADKLSYVDDLIKKLIDLDISIVSIIQDINMKKGNLILTQDTKLLWGDEFIEDKIGDLSFNISLPSFFQVNRVQTEKLYDKVVEFVINEQLEELSKVEEKNCNMYEDEKIEQFSNYKNVDKKDGLNCEDIKTNKNNRNCTNEYENEYENKENYLYNGKNKHLNNLHIWDLYCGTGTISLYLSKYASVVLGNEIFQASIDNARQNAIKNGVKNVHFEAGDCAKIVPLWLEKYKSPDVIVVDPPRKGCDKIVLDTIIKASPRKLIYVSCKPSTLARDVAYLKDYYKVEIIQPVDMFPHTAGVECIVRMSRKDEE